MSKNGSSTSARDHEEAPTMTSIFHRFFRIGRVLAILALAAGAQRAEAAVVLSASAIVTSAATVSVGQTITVQLTVSNTGATSALSVTAFLAAQSADGAAVTLSGPTPATLLEIVPNDSIIYSYSALATAAGNVFFTVSASGDDGGANVDAPLDWSTTVLIETAAALSASLVAVPTPSGTITCVGSSIIVTYTVTNAGQADATLVAPVVKAVAGGGTTVTLVGPTPAAPVTIAGGANITFTYTATGAETGSVFFTATVAGTDENSAAVVSVAQSVSTTVLVTGLTTTAARSNAVVSTGQYFNVTLAVTNTSSVPVTNLSPRVRVGPGASFVTLVSGPQPTAPLDLEPGASQTFTYTYSPVGAGVVTFSLTAAGTTTCGTALSFATVSVTVLTATALAAQFNTVFSVTATGMKFLVLLTVTNTGGTSATSVKAAIPLVFGSGSATTTTGSNPSSKTLAAGAAVTFTWT
ncbi:MAG: hypothetical protein AAB368_15915, partial [bacterium]